MESIKKFYQIIEIQHYSKETFKSYAYHIAKFRRYYGDNVTEENIHRHLHYLTTNDYSPATINITRASLLYYANKILKTEIKSEAIETAKRPKSLPKPIDQSVITLILNNTSNLKHKIVIEILYGSGLRLGEVVVLKWSDIDFTNKILRVNNGKGAKDRLVKVSDLAIQHLLDYKGLRYNKASEYIFDSMARPETHITKKTVQKILENACEKANIQLVTPHQLRHSYATHSLEYGTDIAKIQKALGHSSPKTTMIYIQVSRKTISMMESPLDKLAFNQK